MADDQLFTIQIEIDAATRQRLELAKLLYSLATKQQRNPTWSDAVSLLCAMTPLADLLAQIVQGGVTPEGMIPNGQPEPRSSTPDTQQGAGSAPKTRKRRGPTPSQ
jgi:hypothetical protein